MSSEFLQDVVEGLSQTQKTLPCKYFYDERGSQLFTEICEQEEYYLTNTEMTLLKNNAQDIAEIAGKGAHIIEPGSGAGEKIQTLLRALNEPCCYMPLDISEEILQASANTIAKAFPTIEVKPVQLDFTTNVKLPECNALHNKRLVFFPGSTIGNFNQEEVVEFLSKLRCMAGQNGSLLIGVDLIKDKDILEAAYDDKNGVTAEFNKNLLHRINDELDADFDLSAFAHNAFFNDEESRIEMHLKSKLNQSVKIQDKTFDFAKGETIHTENSYKYSVSGFTQLAQDNGFELEKVWQDENELFGLFYLNVKQH